MVLRAIRFYTEIKYLIREVVLFALAGNACIGLHVWLLRHHWESRFYVYDFWRKQGVRYTFLRGPVMTMAEYKRRHGVTGY